MAEVDHYEPLLKQLRWKPRDVLVTRMQHGPGSRVVSLQGPHGQQVLVRLGQDVGHLPGYALVLEQLQAAGEPGVVPFAWASLGGGEVGFLSQARPDAHLHPPGWGLGWGLVQLLGILQTLRDAGVAVWQLSPSWLVWDPSALPRLVDLRWMLDPGRIAAGYWTHPDLLRGGAEQRCRPPVWAQRAAGGRPAPVDSAVWSCIQLALARYPAERGAAELASLLTSTCNLREVLEVTFRVLGLPEIADGEPASASSPSRVELPQWTYSPSSASKSPASRRRFTSLR